MVVNVIYNLPFYEELKRWLDRIGFKRYSCKFSCKTFSQHSLFFILTLKEKLNLSYRRVVKIIKDLGIYRNLGILKVPHFTTIQKFCDRLDKKILHLLMKIFVPKKTETIIGDGTGFSVTNPSFHYLSVLRRFTGKRQIIKSPINTVIFADLKTRIVTHVNTSVRKTHEAKLSKPMLEELNCENFIYDKALDSKKIRKKLEEQNINPIIPYRKNARKPKKINEKLYKQRNIAESIISSIKRKYGKTIKNKKPQNQQKQTLLKILNYNINITLKKIINLLKQMISTKPNQKQILSSYMIIMS